MIFSSRLTLASALSYSLPLYLQWQWVNNAIYFSITNMMISFIVKLHTLHRQHQWDLPSFLLRDMGGESWYCPQPPFLAYQWLCLEYISTWRKTCVWRITTYVLQGWIGHYCWNKVFTFPCDRNYKIKKQKRNYDTSFRTAREHSEKPLMDSTCDTNCLYHRLQHGTRWVNLLPSKP